MIGKLEITVIKGENLRDADAIGKMVINNIIKLLNIYNLFLN